MKALLSVLSLLLLAIGTCVADDDGRSAFTVTPGRDIGAALKRAERENKRVLVVIVEPGKKQAPHLNATMQAEETKKMVKDHFIVVVLSNRKEKHVAGLVDDVMSVHPAYVIFKPDGAVESKGDAAMGAGPGLKWMEQLVGKP